MITDCHIHIQPLEMFKPEALELIKNKRPNFDQIVEFCQSPKAFLKYLDSAGIGRAVLINYVAPEVIGFSPEVNQWVADYTRADPKPSYLVRRPSSPAFPQHHGGRRADSAAEYPHDQDPSSPSVAVSQRLSSWGERAGNHLPGGGGQRRSRDVPYRHIDFSRRPQ